jgi:hypothetical protein
VVTISDLAAHLPLPLGAAAAGNAAGGGGGWEPWSGHDPVAALEGPEAAQQRRTALLGLLAEVHHGDLLMVADQIRAVAADGVCRFCIWNCRFVLTICANLEAGHLPKHLNHG